MLFHYLGELILIVEAHPKAAANTALGIIIVLSVIGGWVKECILANYEKP